MSEADTHTGYRGVVVGVDGSPGSEVALRWAARDAELRNTALTMVHVVSPTSGPWRESSMVPERMRGQREHGRLVLQQARGIVEGDHPRGSLRVHCEMPSAHAVSALVELSKDAGLVVVGCLGTGTLRGRHLGSVSSGLTHYARCPVAVIHDGISPNSDATAPVVVGIDGSPGSEAATAIAFEEAARRRVGLVAVHAWKPVSAFDSVISVAGKGWPALYAREEEVLTRRLANWTERLPDVPVRQVIVRDDPARPLVDQSRSAQLVVVGSRGSGGFAGMLLGSVSAAVVLLARVPVIVARQR
jgi:nucleotide-binding universal stress UspA family protein